MIERTPRPETQPRKQMKVKLPLVLYSKKVEFIKQEIFARLVLYNFCEAITSHIVVQNKPRKHTY